MWGQRESIKINWRGWDGERERVRERERVWEREREREGRKREGRLLG